MAKQYTYTVTVTGTLPFPVDMMRYDRCTPASESDSSAIHNSITDTRAGPYTVQVLSDGRPALWHPTEGRWKSFGWTVTSVERRPA